MAPYNAVFVSNTMRSGASKYAVDSCFERFSFNFGEGEREGETEQEGEYERDAERARVRGGECERVRRRAPSMLWFGSSSVTVDFHVTVNTKRTVECFTV